MRLAAGRHVAEEAAEIQSKRSQAAKKKSNGSDELTTVSKVPNLTPNTAMGKRNARGGSTAKLRSRSLLHAPLQTPLLATGSRNMEFRTISEVQSSVVRRRNKHGTSTLIPLRHKSPIKTTQRSINAINLSTNAGKEIKTTGSSGQMKARSKVASLNSLS